MNLNPLNWFKKKDDSPDIDFRDYIGSYYQHFPPKMAKDVPIPFKETQKNDTGKFDFANCPGMWDYSQYGYIISAPDTIKIKANKAGIVVFQKKRGGNAPVLPMNEKLINGLYNFEDVRPNAWKVDLPWKIVCKENISAFLMPPVYHATYLEDIYVVPGLVDYKDYWTCNFIFSIKRACEVTIKAGDPLLHVLPFWNKPIKASYGLIEVEQMANTLTNGFEAVSQFYRKTYNQKKVFHLGKSDGSDEQ
jgi:hypothetical protein